MKRLLAGITAGIALAAGLIPATGVHASAKSTTTGPPCAVKFIIGKQTCYAPAQARVAERQGPWAVNPTAAVSLTYGSGLSQVSFVRFPGSRGSAEIDYLYGPLRRDYGHQQRYPVAIRIIESNQRADVSRFNPAWTQQICGRQVEISPAANPNRPHPAYGPWYLIANFPHGNRSLGIVANSDKSLLTTLACRLMQNQ